MSGSARVTVALGVVFLGLAAWAAVHPRSFATVLADFGPFNAHPVHALSHLADVGDASSPLVGWAEVALLVAGTAVLLYLTGTQRTSVKQKGQS